MGIAIVLGEFFFCILQRTGLRSARYENCGTPFETLYNIYKSKVRHWCLFYRTGIARLDAFSNRL